MKKVIGVSLLSFLILLVSCSSNSYTKTTDSRINQFVLDITTLEENGSLKIFLKDSNDNVYLLDTITFPNDIPELTYAFTHEIQGEPYIISGISYYEDYRDAKHPYINWEKSYTTLIYKCDINYQCQYDREISNFFGSGGVLVNYNTNEVLTSYSFKEESAVKEALKSEFFNNWVVNGKPIRKGYTTRDTVLKDCLGYVCDSTSLLIEGTSFIMNEIGSGWLKISYTENDKEVEGWIRFEDANLYN